MSNYPLTRPEHRGLPPVERTVRVVVREATGT